MRDFVDRVRRRDASTGPLDEAVYVTRVIARAYESSARRRALPLDDEAAGARAGRRARFGGDRRGLARRSRPPEDARDAETPPVATGARGRPGRCAAAGLGVLAAAGVVGVPRRDAGTSLVERRGPGATRSGSPLAAAVNLRRCTRWPAAGARCSRPLAPLVSQTEAFQAMVMGFAVSLVVPARARRAGARGVAGRRTGLPRADDPRLDPARPARERRRPLLRDRGAAAVLLDLPAWLHSAIWLAVAVLRRRGERRLLLPPRRPGRPALGRPRRSGATRRAPRSPASWPARAWGSRRCATGRRSSRSLGASLVAWVLEIRRRRLHAARVRHPRCRSARACSS